MLVSSFHPVGSLLPIKTTYEYVSGLRIFQGTGGSGTVAGLQSTLLAVSQPWSCTSFPHLHIS